MDSGYIRVRDQLWLWVDTVNKKGRGEVDTRSAQSQEDAKEGERIVREPASVENQGQKSKEEEARSGEHKKERAISSGGGAIFMGNVSAGRDFAYNQG